MGRKMKKVTPYQLATLASQIDPERCKTQPHDVLRDAVHLLREAESELWRAVKEDKEDAEYWEGYEEMIQTVRKDWAKGAKEITGEKRRERAARKVRQFLKHERPGDLSHYERDGFTLAEIDEFGSKFSAWKKPRKGKQGRRKSQHDARLRTELVGLVPIKPRKPR